MEKQERKFNIAITGKLWLTHELTVQQKFFLIEINSLDNEEGCFATNKHFASLFGISETRASLVIKKLKEQGLVTYKSWRDKKKRKRRTLKIAAAAKHFFDLTHNTSLTKVKETSLTKVKETSLTKVKVNKTKSNKTNITTKERKTHEEVLNENFENFEIINLFKEYLKTMYLKNKVFTNKALLLKIEELKAITPNKEKQQEILLKAIKNCNTTFYALNEAEIRAEKEKDTLLIKEVAEIIKKPLEANTEAQKLYYESFKEQTGANISFEVFNNLSYEELRAYEK